jgi:hypothetical protein
MKNPTVEEIMAVRADLISRDPFAKCLNEFLRDTTRREVEIPNLSLTSYQRLYAIAKRGHWLKRSIWIRKDGTSVFLYKSEAELEADRYAE